ncbi:histidine kinase [Fabibacter sp. E12]|nr:histidine kinase [Roseivirga sp. E12]
MKWLFLGATVISLLVILEDYTTYVVNEFNYEYSWYAVPAKAVTNFFIWILFTPIVDWQSRAVVLNKNTDRYKKIILILLTTLLMAFVHRFLSTIAFDGLYFFKSGFMASPLSEKNLQLLYSGTLTSLIQGWILLGLFIAILYYQQYLEKQKELNLAQLKALKMQLHPHFLFNTLHSISSLIDINPKDAQKMTSRLGQLMRSTLDHERKQEASLAEEVEYIQNYLGIEHVRFQDRLEIHYDIEEAALNATLPYLILQPIVENAIKHGIKDMQEGGSIQLSAKVSGDRVVITIQDNGEGVSSDVPGSGIGLSNVLKRLSQFYQNDFELESGQLEGAGYKVEMNVPFLKFQPL